MVPETAAYADTGCEPGHGLGEHEHGGDHPDTDPDEQALLERLEVVPGVFP